jgi:hypothetical protein
VVDQHGKFYRDDEPMMDRGTRCSKLRYTGTISNLDYTCEVFIDGVSLGKTSKHRAKVFLSLYKKGIKVDSSYLSSLRNIKCFVEPSEKDKLKTAINSFVHAVCDSSGSRGHILRNQIRSYAYQFGLDKAKEKYLSC